MAILQKHTRRQRRRGRRGEARCNRFARATGDIPQNVNFALSAGTVRSFLDGQGIPYDTAPSTDELRPADVAAGAKAFTAPVECWN